MLNLKHDLFFPFLYAKFFHFSMQNFCLWSPWLTICLMVASKFWLTLVITCVFYFVFNFLATIPLVVLKPQSLTCGFFLSQFSVDAKCPYSDKEPCSQVSLIFWCRISRVARIERVIFQIFTILHHLNFPCSITAQDVF